VETKSGQEVVTEQSKRIKSLFEKSVEILLRGRLFQTHEAVTVDTGLNASYGSF